MTKRILTCAQMKEAEQAAVNAGTSFLQLMENAGGAAAEAILRIAEQQGLCKTALMLCGRGNNAGDAFVIARLLAQQGWRCSILPLLSGEFSPLAQQNLERLPKEVRVLTAQASLPLAGGERKENLAEIDLGSAVIVDGVFGTGFHGELAENVRSAFAAANAQDALRVALDAPSGLNCDTGDTSSDTFRAHFTLTFGAYKPGLLAEKNSVYTGKILLMDIGV